MASNPEPLSVTARNKAQCRQFLEHVWNEGNLADAEQGLEELVATWLAEDPEHWPVLRLTLIDPWQERPDIWSEETPEWVRTLGAIADTAQVKHAGETGR